MSAQSGRTTVVHLSDLHATGAGLLYDVVDGIGRLRAVGDYIATAGITPEAVVVTGDLVQRGHVDAYGPLSEALARLERSTGVPVLTALGNHDDPLAARALRGHDRGHHRTVIVDALRFVLLDSSSGELGREQLDWLREELAEPHGAGSVIALHHPPIASPLPTLARAGLRDAAALLDALVGSDVRALLAGHFHHPLAATLRGIPISVGPSLAYHQVMDAGPDRIAGHDHAMFSLVHLTPVGVSTTSIALDSPSPLFSAPAIP